MEEIMTDQGLPDGIPAGINKYHLLATNPELIKALTDQGIDLNKAIEIVEKAGEEFLLKAREAEEAKKKRETDFLIRLADSCGAKGIADLLRKAQVGKIQHLTFWR